MSFKQHTLPNGLTILAEVDPEAHSAAAGFYVKTGARDETPMLMGVSHFLEHMMFKGTADLTAEELNRRFDEIGARNNAFTSNEMTCFYAHVLPEVVPDTIELLGRMMRPALRSEDFETERGVILEEIAMYQDNPFWVLYENATEKHFGAHPLSHRVLGTKDTITAMKPDDMRAYFNARYSGDNTIVALAGKLDFDAACRQIESLCGGWPSTRPGRDPKLPRVGGGDFTMKDEKVSRGYFLTLAQAPGVADEDRYPAAMLAQILGMPDNSRLHWALLETGLAEEAQSSYDPHDGFGEYFVYASGDPERLPEIESVIARERDALIQSVTQDDLDRLISKVITAATLGGERPADRMHRLGRLWLYLQKRIPLDQEIERLKSVTLDDLRRVHEKYPLTPVTTGRLIPAA